MGSNGVFNNVVKKVPTPSISSPTTSEVSQSEATNADGYDSKKTKGRSTTIIKGLKGVKKNQTNYSLGETSLLGKI